jgi:hypothetical protein
LIVGSIGATICHGQCITFTVIRAHNRMIKRVGLFFAVAGVGFIADIKKPSL